jgi:hypothetical protein
LALAKGEESQGANIKNADRSLNVNFDAGPMPGRCYALFFNQVKSGRLEIAEAYGYSAENPKIHTNIEIDNPRLLGIDDIMSVVGAVQLHVTDSQTERIQADQSVHFALTKTLWDNYRISQFSKLDLGQDWGELLVSFEGTASFYIGRRQAWLQERAQKATATRPIDTWRPERPGSPPPAKAAKAGARNFERGSVSASAPRKTPIKLWRAALYGALFMIAVRALHAATSTDPFIPAGPNSIAEFLGYLSVGVFLFVGIAYINDRLLARPAS